MKQYSIFSVKYNYSLVNKHFFLKGKLKRTLYFYIFDKFQINFDLI